MGLGEGWGTGDASVDEVIENVKRVFRAFQGQLMVAWLALAGVTLIFAVIEMTFALLSSVVGVGIFGLLVVPVSLVGGLAGLVVLAAQFSLYSPLRQKIFAGFDPGDWQTAIKSNLSSVVRILLTILVLGVGTGVGMMCCVIPGLVVAFFGSMAPYLMATRPELDMVDAFKRSYVLAKRYWMIFVVTIGALMGAGLIAGCFFGAAGTMNTMLGSFGSVLAPGFNWVGATLFQLGIFCVWGGVFITVDEKEGATV